MASYAISDIHGSNDKLNNLLNKLSLNKADKLFLLGDYVDRGPDSKGVLDTIFKLKNTGFNIGFNAGKDSGQTIFHCHMHIIPRRKNDVKDPIGGVRNVIPGKGNYKK